MSKLGEEAFPPIHNSDLIGVDPWPYLEAWELKPDDVHKKLVELGALAAAADDPATPRVIIIDIRERADFDAAHLPGSRLLELGNKKEPDPFEDSRTLARQWTVLARRLGKEGDSSFADLEGKVIITVCYLGSSCGCTFLATRHPFHPLPTPDC
jgi:rhodanese-related sulfurtransferase